MTLNVCERVELLQVEGASFILVFINGVPLTRVFLSVASSCNDVGGEKQEGIIVTTYHSQEENPSGKLRPSKSEEKV